MYTIKNNQDYCFEEKKSKFICVLYKVTNMNDVKKHLEDAKILYKNANHYCYAFILDNTKYANDDGEPAKTAGYPILNVLSGQKLNNVMAVVIRYYGGIKLGTGGLTRCYSKAVIDCLKKVDLNVLILSKIIEIELTYDKFNSYKNILDKCIIIDKSFSEVIKLKINISNDDLQNISNEYTIIKESYIEKNSYL